MGREMSRGGGWVVISERLRWRRVRTIVVVLLGLLARRTRSRRIALSCVSGVVVVVGLLGFLSATFVVLISQKADGDGGDYEK